MKPRLTEKREALQGESSFHYLKAEKREKKGEGSGGRDWYALKLLAQVQEMNFFKN